MRTVYIMTWVMVAVFLIGETARRGIDYFAINATTMIEDYLCGLLLVAAALVWRASNRYGPPLMASAWPYATGGMFVPFAAHLEAWLRQETFRPDHPHEDLNSVILKGVIWAVCLICFVASLVNAASKTRSG
ncbi:hypothetical protein ROA7450_01824 [Roseovarius albus]|uniref:Uncharacterized protein n=1 Tax=Roseovarius albus TaxID=1247867 RepID=A0A1X6Z3U3_9RHOB|nr:hypothetical protein [Roseovarius albus]SLN37837.1 hypothetical protein ROA7450_01824 [Roseovarius albus]